MGAHKLAVVLLNYANWSDTLECLESLTRVPAPELSVVVVDTGSPDDSVARLRRWVESGADARPETAPWSGLPAAATQRPAGVRVVEPEESPAPHDLPPLSRALTILPSPRRLGFAGGCNAGMRHALADPRVRYLWLLNNDAIVAPAAPARLIARADEIGADLGALGTLIADYREPDRIQILGGGRIRRHSAEAMIPFHGLPIARASELAATGNDLDYISGASLLTTAEAIREVGPLDETMHLYWEDTDFCARLRDAGRRLAVCAEAVIWHKGHASTGGINCYTKYHNFRSATVYMRRHRRSWRTPLAVRLCKSLARDLLGGRPRDAAASIRGLAAGLRLAHSARPPEAWPAPRRTMSTDA